MNRRKIFSGVYGGAVIILGIWLENRGMTLASQIAVISAIALLAPVSIGIIAEGVRKTWFWLLVVSSVLLHSAVLWRLLPSLPFPTLGVAIIVGGIECLGLILLSAKALDIFGCFGDSQPTTRMRDQIRFKRRH